MATGSFIEGDWNMLYISKFTEAKLGIKVKNYDMDISDFAEYAKAVYNYNQSHSDKIAFITFPRTDMTPFFNQIAKSAFENDKNVTTQKLVDYMTEIYEALEKLGNYRPLEVNIKYDSDKILYHDKALFVYYTSWINLY